MPHFELMMCNIIISSSEKKDARLRRNGKVFKFSSYFFHQLIWKVLRLWFNMFFKYRTEGSHKLLVTFLSTFSSAAASNSKVGALECWCSITIQKCCIQVCCLCNGRGMLPLCLVRKQSLRHKFPFLINYWPYSFA